MWCRERQKVVWSYFYVESTKSEFIETEYTDGCQRWRIGHGGSGEDGQKEQTSSYKINKFWA